MRHTYYKSDMTDYNLKSLDLITISATEQAVLKTLKVKAVEWEYLMHRAIQKEDPDLLSASAYKTWITAGDLLSHSITNAISELFLEVLHRRAAATTPQLAPEDTNN